MDLLKSVSNLFFNSPTSPSTSPDMITLEGVFYLTHPDTIRGQWECLYPDAQITLRRNNIDPSLDTSTTTTQSKKFDFSLCVERIYDEDDLVSNDEAEETKLYSKNKSHSNNYQFKQFQVATSMNFHLGERDSCPTLRWMDPLQDSNDVYEFVVKDTTSISDIKAFKKTMLCCLYEVQFQRLHTYASEADLEKLLFVPANLSKKKSIHQPSSASPVASSEKNKPTPSLSNQSKIIAPSPSREDEQTTPTKLTPKAHSVTSVPLPPPLTNPLSSLDLPKCQPLPNTTILDSEFDATFFLFNSHSFEFEEQLPHVTVQLFTIRNQPDTSYLSICDQDEITFLNQPLEIAMNHSFHLPEFAFVWNFVNTKNSLAFSLALKFEKETEYHTFRKRFTELYMQATLHQSLLQMKLDDSELDYLMKQRSVKSNLNEPTSTTLHSSNDFQQDESEEAIDVDVEEVEDDADVYVSSSANDSAIQNTSELESEKLDYKVKNSLLKVGQLRTYVVRGNQLGVFGYTSKGGIQYKGTVPLVFGKKKPLQATKALLHQQESNFIFTDQSETASSNSAKVYQMDLETQKIVRDWDVQAESTTNQPSNLVLRDLVNPTKQANDPTLIGILNQGLITMDPRAPKVMQWENAQTYKTKVDLHCATTTANGEIAVGNTKGELRLFDRMGIRAKTQLQGASEPILHLDVSVEGHLVLATCHSHLLLFDVRKSSQDGKTGFQTRMASHEKPEAIRLQLSPQHVTLLETSIHFTKAHFDTSTHKTTRIVTSTGKYLVTWDLDQVLKGEKYKYKIKKMDDVVIDDQFQYGNSQRIIMALPDDVKSVATHALKEPRFMTRKSSDSSSQKSRNF
ncbi:hypothetical protein HMI54_004684 [Coelomomyces lativittatus]|nr:hypothetical protein HMI54_004684 [Coelomomyces lativittatus]KAJ1508992.1 hypothetical protein HMI56_007019 [Coelomomyces lativittatus]KAJ1509132.1 hypothetical protein HMI55_000090 [Coelomomyces lativittatus]